MRGDIAYELYVKQPMTAVMNQMEEDAAAFDIEADELNRAVFGWVLERINGTIPDWLPIELDKLRD